LALERTLKDSLQTAGTVMALNYSHYALFVLYFNSVFNKKYPKDTLLYSSANATEENVLNRDNEGYQELYRIQEETKNGQLKVITTEYPNIGLGGTIISKNTSYVLYQITFTLKSDCTEQCELLLVPQTTKGFYPLPMPEKYIRIASAQRAIVVDNFDPSRLGRVRVKYPWQDGLIKKDEQHIYDLSAQTRIFFGCCEPVSYTMVEILLEDKTLDTYTETPTYYISTGRQEQATFTKTDFLESIKKEKIKIKI
jgi:hypothetical protein